MWCQLRISRGSYRGIGRDKADTHRAVRNDLMQQRHDRDHRALGRQPEAAQGFEMLDHPHARLP
jgi:hypothetical protein